jgi:hypothetical protein
LNSVALSLARTVRRYGNSGPLPGKSRRIAGLHPTDPTSVLAMTSSAVGTNFIGVKVTWQSVNTRTYYLQRATDLLSPSGFSSIQSNLAGKIGTTSYTDSTATNGGPYFYRVGVQ